MPDATPSGSHGSVEIAVVGSLNLDVSIPVDHLPEPGETVLGGDALWSPGGKGANQAVGTARLGRSVAMIGCVGEDDPGRQLVDNLRVDEVDSRFVAVLEGVSTGIATIAVAPDGENQIIVSPGANNRLTASHVDAAQSILESATVTLAQFESPLAVILHAARGCMGRFVLNPAPAPAALDDDGRATLDALLSKADVVVPNQGELATLLGEERANTSEGLEAQARRLNALGPAVVVTLGADGALVVDRGVNERVAAHSVEAIDATAAGDSFCAGLADALCEGRTLVESVEWAVSVAAVTVTRRGAQASLPTRAEVTQAG